MFFEYILEGHFLDFSKNKQVQNKNTGTNKLLIINKVRNQDTSNSLSRSHEEVQVNRKLHDKTIKFIINEYKCLKRNVQQEK